MFDALDISASALKAQRARIDTIAGNVANLDATRSENGEKVPYRRRFAVFASGESAGSSRPGVHVEEIAVDQSPFRKVYDPSHPDADADGNVLMPNVDLAIENVNMIEATRAYEANVTMMDSVKAMLNATLRLLA
jgi:flagellar basal-body rod protein FlgC